jgi:hypothetical protein
MIFIILKYFDFCFVWGASPGSAGCFNKATQTPNAGHPISVNNDSTKHVLYSGTFWPTSRNLSRHNFLRATIADCSLVVQTPYVGIVV